MAGTTTHMNLPYPTGTDLVAGVDNAIQALAEAIDDQIGSDWNTWTPTITAETGTFTTVSGDGRHLRTGKLVIWTLAILITTVGSAANGLRFTLPLTARTSGQYIGGGRSPALLQCQVYAISTSQAQCTEYDNTTPISVGTVQMSGIYEAA